MAFFPALGGSRLRIAAVGFLGLRALLEELAPGYSSLAEVVILDKAYGDAVESIAHLRQAGGVDAVVSAGSNGSFLREHLDLPVVLVKPGGFDVMQGLARASGKAQRLAVVTYGEVPSELAHFNERFSLQVDLRSYTTEEEAEACVQELAASGTEAVVAPGLVVDLARSYGLEGVLLYSRGAVREAMEGAVEVARIARLEAAKREKLSTILGHLKDGVVAVNLDERIETINPEMESIIGLSAAQLIGQRLGDVRSELSLAGTLRTGEAVVEQVQQVNGKTVVVTRMPIVEQGRQTGAVLICQDPIAIQRLDRSLRSRAQPGSRHARYGLSNLIGQSEALQRVRQRARTCAQSSATVLIVGESGTGKELLAQGIHNASARQSQPFVAINCAAFPETLLESELFGYVDGAFTGSSRGGKVGLFEAAHTGTIFLDEIGDMPLPLQTRLLRVLQEKEVLRVGATEPTPVDVRVIAATHRNMEQQVAQGEFRQDLYYRLNILLVHLPPLRARLADLPMLASHLADKIATRLNNRKLADEGLINVLVEAAQGYDWPGNIRELENLIERTMVFHEPLRMGGPVTREALQEIAPELFSLRDAKPSQALRSSRAEAELMLLRDVLNECGGNRELAAERLGISRTTLWRKLRRLNELKP
ncbi:propionate catabolism operon regulatory protein PrpR [Pollutimonas harenae]|uniref:Propionate catabolism operon regulatory protein PrpR n=1 Tax=Pollutimonas harenae TaxID=657015 RepID=A0A853GW32_9BURK|nr:propionate catabolism operon regulatory protein PrpR [Pollutimonas harenae]NYT86541.1 propionate catabolism operon regulatory protein PrpR [Pollutimonas harenae]TEA69717.1 propionate catabolism operon regulatory protein PrpR [Pollutimonas harenae]